MDLLKGKISKRKIENLYHPTFKEISLHESQRQPICPLKNIKTVEHKHTINPRVTEMTEDGTYFHPIK